MLWEKLKSNSVMLSSEEDIEKVFEIGKVLGKGSFGTVKQGIHRETKVTCALKVLERCELFKGGGNDLRGPVVLTASTTNYTSSSSEFISRASPERAVRRLRRLVNELEVMGLLRDVDWNVAHIHGCWVTPEKIYVAMQIVDKAMDLFEYVVGKFPLPKGVVSQLFQSICSTVSKLHTVGIVHRDLKLENM